jgi:hypothetical protein
VPRSEIDHVNGPEPVAWNTAANGVPATTLARVVVVITVGAATVTVNVLVAVEPAVLAALTVNV